MNSWRRWFSRKKKWEQDLSEELRFHIEQQTAANVAAGMPREEARRQAMLQLGAIEGVKEYCREERRAFWLESLWTDVRYGARMLRKSPGFTMVAILTLALGIGANTAIFTILDGVLLQALPVRDPAQLVLLQWHTHHGPKYDEYSGFGDCDDGSDAAHHWGCSYSSPMFDAIHSGVTVFDGVCAFAGPAKLTMTGPGAASSVNGEIISGDYFKVLGVRTSIGRPIEAGDDTTAASPVVVLTNAFWQRAFGGSTSAVGSTIRLNGVPFAIVGVAEPSFASLTPGKTQDLWLARSIFPRVDVRNGWSRIDDPTNAWLAIVARLKHGVPREEAQNAVSLLFRNELVHDSHPLSDENQNPSITLLSAQDGLVGEKATFRTPLYILTIAAGIILLIAWANLAGLLLARSRTRLREVAVRLALGASRARVVRQLLVESITLAVLGGTLGAFFAWWGVHVIVALVSSESPRPFTFQISPDIRILLFTAAASIASGIFFGLAPALGCTRINLTPVLKQGAGLYSNAMPARRGRLSLGNALVMAQIALAVVVLVGAGLLVRTLQNLRTLDPGFDSKSVLLFGIDPPLSGYQVAQIQNLYRDMRDRFSALPGVISVSYSQLALLSGNTIGGGISIEGQPENSDAYANQLSVGLDFFQTMRIPLLVGRTFTSSDFNESAPSTVFVPAVINETFARRFFDKQNPLGQGLNKGNSEGSNGDTTSGKQKSKYWQIVGVVKDAKYNNLRDEIEPTVYLPVRGGGVHFELRTAANPELLVPAVRNIVRQLDANLPLSNISTETEEINHRLFREDFLARLSAICGLLSLLLACIGVYGLLAYEVSLRTREIGIRMALGAEPRNVLRLVVGKGIALAILGAIIGSAVAVGLTRYLQSLLFGVRAGDPATFIGVAAVLVVVVLAACVIPARRAMRVDPMVALRHE